MEFEREKVYAVINILPGGVCIIRRMFYAFNTKIDLLKGSEVGVARLEVNGTHRPFQVERIIRVRTPEETLIEEPAIDHSIQNGMHVFEFGNVKEYISIKKHILIDDRMRLDLGDAKMNEPVYLTESTPKFTARVHHVLINNRLAQILHVKNYTNQRFDEAEVLVSAAEPERSHASRGVQYGMAAMSAPPGDAPATEYSVFFIKNVEANVDQKFVMKERDVTVLKTFEVKIGPDVYPRGGSSTVVCNLGESVPPGLFTIMTDGGTLIAEGNVTKNYPSGNSFPVGKSGWITFQVQTTEERDRNRNLVKQDMRVLVKNHSEEKQLVQIVSTKEPISMEKWRTEEGNWIREIPIDGGKTFEQLVHYNF